MKDYFDRHAHEWVEAAYDADVRFPVGSERVRLAIEGVAPAMQARALGSPTSAAAAGSSASTPRTSAGARSESTTPRG